VRADERDQFVERGDTLAGNFLIQELGLVFVDGGRRQRDQNLAIGMGRKLDGDELDWDWVRRRRSAGLNVKHLILRLARPAPETSGDGQQGGDL
jgi:hypothetical protein